MDMHDIAMVANIVKGSGGTSDYTDLDNKPSINGEELSGNMTAAQLSLAGLDSSGKVPMNQLPPAAIERMTVVEDDTARFALTTDTVQNGDTVKVKSTEKMYMVVDDTNLDTEAGYSVYVAGRAAEAVADEDGNNIKESLASKVDKEPGKSLSTNDYTDDDKDTLAWAVNNGVKNLLEITAESRTISGVTFTVDKAAGTITANGTATAHIQFTLSDKVGDFLEDNVSYTLTGCPTSGSYANSYALYVFNTANDHTVWKDDGNGETYTIPPDLSLSALHILLRPNTTVSNLVFKPMIRPAYITDDTFQPYAMSNAELTQRLLALEAAMNN